MLLGGGKNSNDYFERYDAYPFTIQQLLLTVTRPSSSYESVQLLVLDFTGAPVHVTRTT